ncbi:MAG TPA: SulP family inorganic anion transporter, partial [Steroidobacteraceae bacterium]|nr:SulP family inorganic anion transporter [Steroidobacteraceae bacterium]
MKDAISRDEPARKVLRQLMGVDTRPADRENVMPSSALMLHCSQHPFLLGWETTFLHSPAPGREDGGSVEQGQMVTYAIFADGRWHGRMRAPARQQRLANILAKATLSTPPSRRLPRPTPIKANATMQFSRTRCVQDTWKRSWNEQTNQFKEGTTMKSTHDHTAPVRFSILQGLLPITAAQIPAEILAGITLAAIAIPEVMGYTKISGTPVITGLYTMLIPTALFAPFGSSRHLVVVADSATAAILAAGLVGIASIGSDQYLALAGVLALMAAAFLILARVMRLGFLADFLSRTVLIGFLTGVGVQIALGQIGGMLGLEGGGHGTLGKLWHTLQQLGQVNRYELMIALAVLVVVVGLKKVSKKIPAELIAVIGSLVASGVFGLNTKLHVLGTVPSGLPHLGLPAVDWHWQVITTLIPTGFAMFVVIPGPKCGDLPRICHALRREFQREHRSGRSGPGQYWRRPVRHLRRQRQPNQDANRRQRGRPQPTVAPGDGGDR